jgi:hypothetical protein
LLLPSHASSSAILTAQCRSHSLPEIRQDNEVRELLPLALIRCCRFYGNEQGGMYLHFSVLALYLWVTDLNACAPLL